jgi:CheY-like chemotaxis protein
LKDRVIHVNLHVVPDGEAAVSFLHGEGKYSGVEFPDPILLDLNMPRMDGREFLRVAKEDPCFRRISMVVLTTSKDVDDIIKSYDLHANSYVRKPLGMFDFITAIRSIEAFWYSIASLPARSDV